jgi:hypothetical protein
MDVGRDVSRKSALVFGRRILYIGGFMGVVYRLLVASGILYNLFYF